MLRNTNIIRFLPGITRKAQPVRAISLMKGQKKPITQYLQNDGELYVGPCFLAPIILFIGMFSGWIHHR